MKTKRKTSLRAVRFHGFPPRFKAFLRRAAEAVLAGRRIKKTGDINIVLFSDAEMLKLNKKFLSRAHATDIITFIFSSKPLSGDVYIAEGQSKKQAAEAGHAWKNELVYLVLHGMLHLLDYKDYTPAQKKKMFKVQDRLFGKITGC